MPTPPSAPKKSPSVFPAVTQRRTGSLALDRSNRTHGLSKPKSTAALNATLRRTASLLQLVPRLKLLSSREWSDRLECCAFRMVIKLWCSCGCCACWACSPLSLVWHLFVEVRVKVFCTVFLEFVDQHHINILPSFYGENYKPVCCELELNFNVLSAYTMAQFTPKSTLHSSCLVILLIYSFLHLVP